MLKPALLVEDEALVAMVVEDNLRALGFEPECVLNGRDALASVREAHEPHVLAVIDVGLPDMRGDDLAEQLRRLAPSMKVIVASGYDPTPLARRFAADEHVKIMGKPYSDDDLIQALNSLGFDVAGLNSAD